MVSLEIISLLHIRDRNQDRHTTTHKCRQLESVKWRVFWGKIRVINANLDIRLTSSKDPEPQLVYHNEARNHAAIYMALIAACVAVSAFMHEILIWRCLSVDYLICISCFCRFQCPVKGLVEGASRMQRGVVMKITLHQLLVAIAVHSIPEKSSTVQNLS
jgi:hypothetical protein